MKLKSLAILLMSLLCLNAYAMRIHKAHTAHTVKSVKQKGLMAPGFCEIELKNLTYYPVNVHVDYDDGGEDWAKLYPNDPLYIDLFYEAGQYCERGALVYIETESGRPIFNQYVYDGQTVTIDNDLLSQAKSIRKR